MSEILVEVSVRPIVPFCTCFRYHLPVIGTDGAVEA